MVAASKNFRIKRKQRPKISVPFTCRSVASVALRATQYRGVQSNNIFVSLRVCGENRSLGSVDQNGNTLKYDAWNRLISVTNSSGQIIAQYTYDARGYRVTESYPQGGNGVAAGTVNYIYYDSNWQAIEVRTNGTAASDVTSQTVWSAAYVNSPVLQDSFSGGVIQPNSRIYFLHDANWNTTATVTYNATTQTWGVTQRYIYSPYGSLTVLNADFSAPPAGTQPISDYLYQGMTLDAVTGLYYARNRNYSPSLGVWTSQDPAQYINGANTYQMEMSGPVGAVDPSGLSPHMTPQAWQAYNQSQPQTPLSPILNAAGRVGQAVLQGSEQDLQMANRLVNWLAQGLGQDLHLLGKYCPVGFTGWIGTPENHLGIVVAHGNISIGVDANGNTAEYSPEENHISVGQSSHHVGSNGTYFIGGQFPTEFGKPSPFGGGIIINLRKVAGDLDTIVNTVRTWLDSHSGPSPAGLPENYPLP